MNELGIGHAAEFAGRGVDAYDPKLPVVALVVLAACVRVFMHLAQVLLNHAPTVLLGGVGAFGATVMFFLSLTGVCDASNSHGDSLCCHPGESRDPVCKLCF